MPDPCLPLSPTNSTQLNSQLLLGGRFPPRCARALAGGPPLLVSFLAARERTRRRRFCSPAAFFFVASFHLFFFAAFFFPLPRRETINIYCQLPRLPHTMAFSSPLLTRACAPLYSFWERVGATRARAFAAGKRRREREREPLYPFQCDSRPAPPPPLPVNIYKKMIN